MKVYNDALDVSGDKIKHTRHYHVQFFGDDGERGWIPESRMLPFEGEEAFQRYAQEKIAQDRKNRAYYEVRPSRMKGWLVSVRAANEALPMTRNERKVHFTFVYDIPALQKRTKAQGGAAVAAGEPDEYLTTADGMEILPNGVVRKARSGKRKLQEVVALEGGETSGVTPPPKRRKTSSTHRASSDVGSSPLANKSVAQYMVFCQKRQDSIRLDNPDFSKEQVEAALKELWSQLDEEQRSKFIPMGSDVQHISEMMPVNASRGAHDSAEGCTSKYRETFCFVL